MIQQLFDIWRSHAEYLTQQRAGNIALIREVLGSIIFDHLVPGANGSQLLRQ
jgi:hypothetical protein